MTDDQPTKRDRVLGCFLGGAVGDALGNDIEFLSLAAIRGRFGSTRRRACSNRSGPRRTSASTPTMICNAYASSGTSHRFAV